MVDDRRLYSEGAYVENVYNTFIRHLYQEGAYVEHNYNTIQRRLYSIGAYVEYTIEPPIYDIADIDVNSLGVLPTGDPLTGKDGRIWIQPGGANQPVYLLGCTDFSDLVEDKGELELILCYDNFGRLKVVGELEGSPEMVTATILEVMSVARSWLEQLDCSFSLYALQRCGGRADLFDNYRRGESLVNCRVSQKVYSGLVQMFKDDPSMLAMDVEAWPPLVHINQPTTVLVASNQNNLTDIVANDNLMCECGLNVQPGEKIFVGSSAFMNNAFSTLFYSLDIGQSWNFSTAYPFTKGMNISSIARVIMSNEQSRIIISMFGNGSAIQGFLAYTDDLGITWELVSIGGIAAGHGAPDVGCLFVSGKNVFLASASGYIYKSTDAGETWQAVENALLSAVDYHHIHFTRRFGIAGGENGVVILTDNFGDNWYLAGAAPSVNIIRSVARLDRVRLWAADNGGNLWYSNDLGDSWAARAGWAGHGTGEIVDLRFYDEFHGWFLHKDVLGYGHIFYTFNGGHNWQEVDLPSNNAYTALWPVNESKTYVTAYTVPIISERFTAADGTLLRGKTPDIAPAGIVWLGFPLNASEFKISGNKAIPHTAGNNCQWINAAISDCRLSAMVYLSLATEKPAIIGRFFNSNNYWAFRLTSTGHSIVEVNGGVTTVRQSAIVAHPVLAWHSIRVMLSGNTLSMTVNGVDQISYSSSFLNTITIHGIEILTSNNSAFDSFEVLPL